MRCKSVAWNSRKIPSLISISLRASSAATGMPESLQVSFHCMVVRRNLGKGSSLSTSASGLTRELCALDFGISTIALTVRGCWQRSSGFNKAPKSKKKRFSLSWPLDRDNLPAYASQILRPRCPTDSFAINVLLPLPQLWLEVVFRCPFPGIGEGRAIPKFEVVCAGHASVTAGPPHSMQFDN
jgi:hypothetical protein